MSENNHTASEQELEEMIAATDTGARSPEGSVGKLLLVIAFCWSVFQLWIASPLPFMLSDIHLWGDTTLADFIPVLNNTDTRSIHLTFALCLAFLAYPTFKGHHEAISPFRIGSWPA